MASRFQRLPGNYHEVVLDDGAYDVIIAGNVTHLESVDGNQRLFKKLHKALAPGGRLVIFDVIGDQEQGKLQAALYAIGLALRTSQGQVHSLEALKGFLQSAGFSKVDYQPVEVTPYTMGMLVGHQ